jgi:phage terminase small subunit
VKLKIGNQLKQNLKPKADNLKPPTWLSALAKREFKRLAAELDGIGLMTNVDVNQLAVYCRAYARYVELQAGNEDPETGEKSY